MFRIVMNNNIVIPCCADIIHLAAIRDSGLILLPGPGRNRQDRDYTYKDSNTIRNGGKIILC